MDIAIYMEIYHSMQLLANCVSAYQDSDIRVRQVFFYNSLYTVQGIQ